MTCILAACGPRTEEPARAEARPSIVLVTLDTTRADAMGQDTPAFRELASRGLEFRQAYATAPQTLPSHASMMTGLYPAAHGIHENARYLGDDQKLLATALRENGYKTAAFVSAYPLGRQFGLARGFDHYDDSFPAGSTERSARETTDRALAWLQQQAEQPAFVWVHYFEPHYPYQPPGAFADRYRDNPYRGEVAAMDQELGRLVKGVEAHRKSPVAIIVVGDHGEGLGEHGESQHGNLLYQGVMHVPLVLAGPGINPGISNAPVSTRRVFHTILGWAGLDAAQSLRSQNETPEVVLGEAMQPFLQFGWQPQIMAVEDRLKVIQAGKIEAYDVIADPEETRDLASSATISRKVRQSLRDYPIPSVQEAAPANLSEEDRRQLASLGYVSSDAAPVIRPDAPRPRDMAHLFATLDRASGLFVAEEYAAAIPLFEQILTKDPHNLMTALRLAAAHSALGQNDRALAAFRRAQAIAPESLDVSHYLALHYLRVGQWQRAAPLLERVVAATPNRLPALEALATIRERQDRINEALALRQQALSVKKPTPGDLLKTGELAMRVGNTAVALEVMEKARSLQGSAFRNDLELGVLYLDAQRLTEARDALDRVPPSHPRYAMALFKRAQISALLREPDLSTRIEAARKHADSATGELIAREKLFQGTSRN